MATKEPRSSGQSLYLLFVVNTSVIQEEYQSLQQQLTEARNKIESLKSQDVVTQLRTAQDEVESLQEERDRLQTQLGLAQTGEERARQQLKNIVEQELEKAKEDVEKVRQESLEMEQMWKEKVQELEKVCGLVSVILRNVTFIIESG